MNSVCLTFAALVLFWCMFALQSLLNIWMISYDHYSTRRWSWLSSGCIQYVSNFWVKQWCIWLGHILNNIPVSFIHRGTEYRLHCKFFFLLFFVCVCVYSFPAVAHFSSLAQWKQCVNHLQKRAPYPNKASGSSWVCFTQFFFFIFFSWGREDFFREGLCVAGGMELGQASVVHFCSWMFHTCWIPVVLSAQELAL